VTGQRQTLLAASGTDAHDDRDPSRHFIQDDLYQVSPLLGHELVHLAGHGGVDHPDRSCLEHVIHEPPEGFGIRGAVLTKGGLEDRNDAVQDVAGLPHAA
jgi:hypothetical protein